MPAFIVTYDLEAPHLAYRKIAEAMEQFEDCIQIQKTVWLLKSQRAPNDIFHQLDIRIHENDKCFISELPDTALWHQGGKTSSGCVGTMMKAC